MQIINASAINSSKNYLNFLREKHSPKQPNKYRLMELVEHVIIGGEEWCAFPGLHIPAIKARVDSGAKTSTIHASNIHKFNKKGEK